MTHQDTSSDTTMAESEVGGSMDNSVSKRVWAQEAAKSLPLSVLLTSTPEPFQRLLVRAWLDPDSRKAWCRTCKAGQAQVWQHADITLDQAAYPDLARASEELRAAQQKLQHWQRQLCTLRLRYDESVEFEEVANTEDIIGDVAAGLQQVPRHLDLSDIDVTDEALISLAAHLPTLTQLTLPDVLSWPAAFQLPALRRLHITGVLDAPFPEPSQLPALTTLLLQYFPGEHTAPSVAALLPQLADVTIFHTLGEPEELITTTNHTLLRLSLPATELDDALLSLLLRHTPALQHLEVASVIRQGAPGRQCTWRVRKLCMHGIVLPVKSFLHLPAREDGSRMEVVGMEPSCQYLALNQEDLRSADEIIQAMRALRFLSLSSLQYEHGSGVHLDATAMGVSTHRMRRNVSQLPSLTSSHQHIARVFRVAGAMEPPERTVNFKGLLLTEHTLQALSGAPRGSDIKTEACVWFLDPTTPLDTLPCVQGLKQLQLQGHDLDDRALSVLLQCAPQLEELHACDVTLTTDAHSRHTWRLSALHLHKARFSQEPASVKAWSHLPLSQAGLTVWVGESILLDCPEPQVHQAIQDRVKAVHVCGCGERLTLVPAAGLVQDCLTCTLGLVLQLLFKPQSLRSIRLHHCGYTVKVQDVLKQVPEWCATLLFDECMWLCEPVVLTGMLSSLPTTVKEVRISPRPSELHLKAIIASAPDRPMTLKFLYGGCASQMVSSIKARDRQLAQQLRIQCM